MQFNCQWQAYCRELAAKYAAVDPDAEAGSRSPDFSFAGERASSRPAQDMTPLMKGELLLMGLSSILQNH